MKDEKTAKRTSEYIGGKGKGGKGCGRMWWRGSRITNKDKVEA